MQVEDRGGAIKGPYRIDLYYKSHQEALQWGRRKVQVGMFSSLLQYQIIPIINLLSGSYLYSVSYDTEACLCVQVLVVKPGQSSIDYMQVPGPVKSALKGLNWIRNLLF